MARLALEQRPVNVEGYTVVPERLDFLEEIDVKIGDWQTVSLLAYKRPSWEVAHVPERMYFTAIQEDALAIDEDGMLVPCNLSVTLALQSVSQLGCSTYDIL